ncbi:MAG TPA: hypothetical protein VHA12_02615 [Candidatus Nanoarchaeia archaeon]|nr:hypothetical protein [Candidatus Nanoarchaeia archaeon]
MINKKYFAILAMILFSLSSVLALGVTAPYWDERPLNLAPGESKDIQFSLQNMLGDSDVTLKAALIEGQDIATLTDSNLEYTVPFGVKDMPVNMRISIPRSANNGDKYTVGVSFTTVTKSESGQFQLGSAFEKYFDVVVEGAPKNYTWIYVIAIAIVLILVWLFVRRSNK